MSVCLMALSLLAVAADRGGFDGKWVLDSGSTGDETVPVDLVQKIQQKGSDVEVQSTFAEPASGVVPLLYVGVMTNDLTLSTDGSVKQNQIGPFQQASKTILDGTTMTTEWTAVFKGEDINGKWIRTLQPDGTHMTLEIHESSKGEDHSATLNLHRKKVNSLAR
jgi:hypothetical protein